LVLVDLKEAFAKVDTALASLFHRAATAQSGDTGHQAPLFAATAALVILGRSLFILHVLRGAVLALRRTVLTLGRTILTLRRAVLALRRTVASLGRLRVSALVIVFLAGHCEDFGSDRAATR